MQNISASLKLKSNLTLLGCVSPYKDDHAATLSTIRFVSTAKRIVLTPHLNAIISDFQVNSISFLPTPIQTMVFLQNLIEFFIYFSKLTKTPVNANTLFKRMASMPTGLPNNRSHQLSRMIGLPQRKLAFDTNSSELHRFERCSVTSSSTTKKSMTFSQQRKLVSLTGNR